MFKENKRYSYFKNSKSVEVAKLKPPGNVSRVLLAVCLDM